MRPAIASCVLLFLIAAGSGALASGGGSRFQLGAGIVIAPRPYVGASAEIIPVPLVFYRRGGFFLQGIEAGYGWRQQRLFRVRVLVTPRFDGYDSGDSDFLRGMGDRDLSLDLGAGVGWHWRHVEIGLDGTFDLLGNGDGPRVELRVGFPAQRKGWRLVPSLAGSWLSDDVVDYYHGVRTEEARPGRPAYEGEGTVNGEAALLALWRGRGRWGFAGGVSVTRYGSAIDDSPLVDGRVEAGGFAGFLYTFR